MLTAMDITQTLRRNPVPAGLFGRDPHKQVERKNHLTAFLTTFPLGKSLERRVEERPNHVQEVINRRSAE